MTTAVIPEAKITPARRFAATSSLKGEVETNHPSGDRT